jgi:UDP-N-acetylmuramoyl-L-alanyl-D-glutamate--2,6-diaminopimelate ligase
VTGTGPAKKQLTTLLAGLAGLADLAGVCERAVYGLSLDSRQVNPGDLFLAFRGIRTRGHDFVPEAIRRGAVAVAYDASTGPRPRAPSGVPLVGIPELLAKVGTIAARFCDEPSRSLRVVGITGTNGKTSCSHLLAQAVALDSVAGVIGTLGHGVYRPGEGAVLATASQTTPDTVRIHRLLAAMRAEGASHVFMEVSSHALAQGRINGVLLDTAVFTNLTRDHLDYHGDLDAYAAAKALLFQHPGLRRAAINLDDTTGRRFAAALAPEIEAVGYGFGEPVPGMATVRGNDLESRPGGLQMRVSTPWGEGELHSPLIGRFNAHNLLAVLSVLLLQGIPLEEAVRGVRWWWWTMRTRRTPWSRRVGHCAPTATAGCGAYSGAAESVTRANGP